MYQQIFVVIVVESGLWHSIGRVLDWHAFQLIIGYYDNEFGMHHLSLTSNDYVNVNLVYKQLVQIDRKVYKKQEYRHQEIC